MNNYNLPTTDSPFTFDFHLDLFEFYNKRLVNRQWRNEIEERLIRENEAMHAHFAQAKMPLNVFAELFWADPDNTWHTHSQ